MIILPVQASKAAGKAKDVASNATEGASKLAGEATDKSSKAGSSAADTLQSTKEQASGKASELSGKAKLQAKPAADQVHHAHTRCSSQDLAFHQLAGDFVAVPGKHQE